MIKRRGTCPNCGQETYSTTGAPTVKIAEIEADELATLRERLEVAQEGWIAGVHDAALWRARYMAAHEVLLAVEQVIESEVAASEHYPGENARWPSVSQEAYIAMRAAFLAYRASIEAGAPLGWAVAEEAPA